MPINNLSRRQLLVGATTLVAAEAVLGRQSAAAAPPAESLVDLVNGLQGTNSNFGFSRGNTLPIVARLFGMNHWSAQTSDRDGWFFDPNALSFQGARATHQPSPWMGDYGNFAIMAQSGDLALAPEARASKYRPEDLVVKPNYFSVRLLRDGTRIEMSPTDRGAIFRFTFATAATARVIFDAHTSAEVNVVNRSVAGYTNHRSGGAPNDFKLHFYAVFDEPIHGSSVHRSDDNTDDPKPQAVLQAVAEFEGQTTVTMRIATSFISLDQAKQNLDREIGKRGFDEVRREGADVWNKTLGVVRIGGASDAQKRTFYSCLFRSHLFPRMFHEIDASGKTVHYSAYDGKVHDGVAYTDTGLWDGYRTIYPLLTLLQPERLGEIVQGFINAYHEGGWLPQWPSPGTRGGMGGTHSDAVLADALLKIVPGFDRDAAYAAILKDGATPQRGTWEGRPNVEAYLANGYVPGSVSNSLDFAYGDACIALAAKQRGNTADYTTFAGRAQNFRKLFDPAVGFMRAKNADGSWQPDFDEFAWGGPYTEGGAWHWTWAVPHDPAGLMSLFGGQKPFLRKLDRMLLQPGTFHSGGYGHTIHEMLEMAAFPFGQYNQGNQPDHQVLSFFTAAGCPWKTQYWSRRVLDLAYSPDNFPGDEDNGEMAAWYVFNALGFYPMCTGHPTYVLGSPLFRDAWITLANGKTLHLSAPANSARSVYVDRVTINRKPYDNLWFAHEALAQGGEIEFTMAPFPGRQSHTIANLPFSFSPYDAANFDFDYSATEVSINCGGDAVGTRFVGDCFFEGGSATKRESKGAASSDADRIFETARKGPCTYRIPLPMLPQNLPYSLRLSFTSDGAAARESTILNFTINGRSMKGRPFARVDTGGTKRNVVEMLDVRPDHDGAIVVELPGPANGAEASSIYTIEVRSLV